VAYDPSRLHYCRCALPKKHHADPTLETPDPATKAPDLANEAIATQDSSCDPRVQGGRRCVPCACTSLTEERSNSGEVEEGESRRRRDWGAARASRLWTT